MEERRVDPITLAVFEGFLRSTANEMGLSMHRTCRSPVLKLAHDYSNAIFDARPRSIIQADEIPVHLGALKFSTETVAHHFGDEVYPGDVMLHNNPATGGTHKQDWCMYKPVFYAEELMFWAVSTAHMEDVGGVVPGGYNPLAEECYGEGIRIAPVKIYEKGKPRRDVIDLLLGAVRTPNHTRGDMRAQLGALGLCERKLQELLHRYGRETIKACTEEFLDRTEMRVRQAIREMPDGVYEGQSVVEDDGHGSGPSVICCRLTIKGEEVWVEMRSREQLRSYFNSYYANTASAIYFGILSYMDADIAHNEGAFRPIHIDLGPSGTMLNAVEPAATSMATTTPWDSIVECVREAMSKGVPERATAGSCHMCFSIWSAVDPRSSQLYVFSAVPGLMGGGGATWGLDGWPCQGTVATSGGLLYGDIELLEHEYPVHTHAFEFAPDSACPGRWRGGVGGYYEVEPVGHTTMISSIGEGMQFPPPSLVGASSPYNTQRVYRRYIIKGKEKAPLPIHTVTSLRPGERYVSITPGGGGVGDPFMRDLEAVHQDVANGVVSAERAREEYGVVMDPQTLQIDHEATRRLREGKG